MSFDEFTSFSKEITFKASKLALENFDRSLELSLKPDNTLVSKVDIEIESLLRSSISEKYPSHSIEGEEQNPVVGNSKYKWILDPLDGTFNFVRGIPFYGILLGLIKDEEIIYGSYRLPSFKNVFCSGDGEKIINEGFSVGVNVSDTFLGPLILTTDERRLRDSKYFASWSKLTESGFELRTWGDCFGYHQVISGKADIMIDISLKKYDILPLIPILRASGLKILKLSSDYSDIIVYSSEYEKKVMDSFGSYG